MTEDPRLRSLAVAAMAHAIAARPARSGKALMAIGDEYGQHGVVEAALLWVDTLIDDSGRSGEVGRPVRLAFLTEAGVASADDVPPDIAWCGQLIAARFANDEPMFNALVRSSSDDGETFGPYMATLLELVALHYRIALGLAAGSI